MLRYRIVTTDNLREFARRINTLGQEEGWIPQGGVQVTWQIGEDGVQTFTYFQALIRYGDHHTWDESDE